MKQRSLLLVIILGLLLGACSGKNPRQTLSPTLTPEAAAPASLTTQAVQLAPSGGAPAAAPQLVEITGTFSFSNDIILTYYVEHAVALVDLYGFITRDEEWEVPVGGQTLGFMKIDAEKKTGEFNLRLPAQPAGKLADVNPDGKTETGLQVFNVGYFPNLAGGPYSEGDDPSHGWLSFLASTKSDTENEDEIIGGKLVIWSPDADQFFPSAFGADGLLFTDDDPTMPVPAGYTIIDLDQQPFALIHGEQAEMTLYEPKDISVKDFSALSYKEAFDQMFEIMRKEYAFNGIAGKAPDWDKLYSQLSPRIDEAEQKKDAKAYYLALRDFTLAFKDGHVSVDGGDIGTEIIKNEIAGGFGFAIRELDNGQVLVVDVLTGGPADEAGIKKGARITTFNGQPIGDAIGSVTPPTAPHSADFTLRYEQARFLLRVPLETKAMVTFINPGSVPQVADLIAVDEQQSLSATSSFRGYDPNALPVESVVANGNIGYVKINSNYDDLNLIVRLFLRALQTFKKNEVELLIIDMRQNSGGANLGLAGFLTDQEIPLGQLSYYSDKTGQFEPEGQPGKVTVNEEQFSFKKMYLLVDQGCASACELESYGFSQVPGMVVVGQYPTSGTEAEVARGQFKMPEGMELRLPTGRFVLADGSLFLEGKGVQPTVRIPIDEKTVLSDQDPVIQRVLQMADQ